MERVRRATIGFDVQIFRIQFADLLVALEAGHASSRGLNCMPRENQHSFCAADLGYHSFVATAYDTFLMFRRILAQGHSLTLVGSTIDVSGDKENCTPINIRT